MSARQAQKKLREVHPLPSRQAATELRGVRGVRARQGERKLRNVSGKSRRGEEVVKWHKATRIESRGTHAAAEEGLPLHGVTKQET